MEDLKRYRYPAIAAAVVVVVLLVTWLAWLSPEGSKLSTLRASETSLQDQQQSLASRIATLRAEKVHLPRNCTTLAKDLGEIPSTPNIASFYAQVTQLAVSAGVGTPSISYTSTAASGTSTSASGSSSGTASGLPTSPGLSNVSFTLSVSGTAAQLSSFLHGLDTFPRLLTISNLSVTGGPLIQGAGATTPTTTPVSSGSGSGSSSSSGGYTATMTGTIYYAVGEVSLSAVCQAGSGTKS